MGPGRTRPSRPITPIRARVAPSRHSATDRALGLACGRRRRRSLMQRGCRRRRRQMGIGRCAGFPVNLHSSQPRQRPVPAYLHDGACCPTDRRRRLVRRRDLVDIDSGQPDGLTISHLPSPIFVRTGTRECVLLASLTGNEERV